MTITELIEALQVIAADRGDVSVYLDTGDERVSRVEIDERTDDDGPWVALAAGETVWG